MQPMIKAALLCDYAVTSDDGKLSAMGIFSNINFPGLPNAYPRFFVFIIVSMDTGNHHLSLGIVDPVGEQVLPEQPAVDVEVAFANADTNLVIDFNNLVFNRTGIYQVQLFVNERLAHTVPLTVGAVSPDDFGPMRAN